MGKKFNILYWNIHFADGAGATKTGLFNSSEIIKEEINGIIKGKEIDAIIFTEAHPQFDSENYNKELYNYFKKEKYHVYPYDDNKIKKYPFEKNGKKKNGILIATKKEFSIYDSSLDNPNFLLLRSKDGKIILGGLRICNYNAKSYEEQIERIKLKLKFDRKTSFILLGDYNPGSIPSEKYLIANNIVLKDRIDYLRKMYRNRKKGDLEEEKKIALYYVSSKISHMICKSNCDISNVFDCEVGTNVNETGEYTNPDKIFLLNCNIISFKCAKTAEQVYFDKDSLNEKGHVKNGGKGIVLNEIAKLRKKEIFNENISIKYKRFGLGVPAPYPDHNLLFASIDLGD